MPQDRHAEQHHKSDRRVFAERHADAPGKPDARQADLGEFSGEEQHHRGQHGRKPEPGIASRAAHTENDDQCERDEEHQPDCADQRVKARGHGFWIHRIEEPRPRHQLHDDERHGQRRNQPWQPGGAIEFEHAAPRHEPCAEHERADERGDENHKALDRLELPPEEERLIAARDAAQRQGNCKPEIFSAARIGGDQAQHHDSGQEEQQCNDGVPRIAFENRQPLQVILRGNGALSADGRSNVNAAAARRDPRPHPDANGDDDRAACGLARKHEHPRRLIAVCRRCGAREVAHATEEHTIGVSLIGTVDGPWTEKREAFVRRRRHIQANAIPRKTVILGMSLRRPTGNVTANSDIAVGRAGLRRKIDPFPSGIVKPGLSPAGIVPNLKRPGAVQRDCRMTEDDCDRLHRCRDGVGRDRDRKEQRYCAKNPATRYRRFVSPHEHPLLRTVRERTS